MKLTAKVSPNSWSYVMNEKGNYLRMTLEGWGSCTPPEVLQVYLDGLSEEGKKELSDDCDGVKDAFD